MKLGTQTGSLVNHIMSQGSSKEPQIGDGATILCWTDRNPATVVFIDQVKNIVGVTDDSYHRLDSNGMSESQEYEYISNPNGFVRYFRKNKQNQYIQVTLNKETNRWNKTNGNNLIIGRREKYHDFSF